MYLFLKGLYSFNNNKCKIILRMVSLGKSEMIMATFWLFLFLLCFVEGFFCGRGNGDDRFEKVFFFLGRCIKTKVQFLFTSNRHINLFCLAEIGYHPKCQVMSVIWCSAPFLSKQYSCSVRSSASVHMAQHHKACKR